MEMVARRHILAGASVFFSCLVAAGFRQADLPGVEAASRQVPRCDSVLADARMVALVDRMNGLSKVPVSVWNAYRPEQQAYVFVLDNDAGAPCGVVWRDGAVRTTLAFAGRPRLLTPMFGFHFTRSLGGPASAAAESKWASWTQPPAIAQQLDAAGIERAVLVAVVPEIRLPFELKDQHLFDIAVHESFHVNVQAPLWLGAATERRWPDWDRLSPSRAELVARCYAPAAPPAASERQLLVDAAMSALTNGPESAICPASRRFIEARRARWTSRASVGVPIEHTGGDSSSASMSCEQAEAIMELREGVPDFVYWQTAFEGGSVSRERVAQRFGASQPELFYLTGAMQLVILRRLTRKTFDQIPRSIVASDSWRSGSLFGRFEGEIARRCR